MSGGEQRIYLEGGPALYDRGGVLSVLRDPFIRVGGAEQGGRACLGFHKCCFAELRACMPACPICCAHPSCRARSPASSLTHISAAPCPLPCQQALSMEESFMAEDEAEDAAEEREALAATAAKRAAVKARQPKPLDQGGGLYFYERLWLGWVNWRKRAAAVPVAAAPPAAAPAATQPTAAEQQPAAAVRAA